MVPPPRYASSTYLAPYQLLTYIDYIAYAVIHISVTILQLPFCSLLSQQLHIPRAPYSHITENTSFTFLPVFVAVQITPESSLNAPSSTAWKDSTALRLHNNFNTILSTF